MMSQLKAAILEELPQCIFISDFNGQIIYLNNAAQSFSKATALNAEINLHTLFNFNALNTTLRQHLNLALKTGNPLKLEQVNVIRKEDDQELTINISIKKVGDEVKNVMVIIDDQTKDITRNIIIHNYKEKAKQQDEELIRLDRLLTLNEMTTGFAHEINQPLTAISNYATASKYLMAAKEYSNVLTQLNEIVLQAERANKITQNIRKFTGSPYAHKDCFSVNRVVSDSIRFLKNLSSDSGVDIIFHKEKVGCWITGDYIQVQQVLINVLKNSLDAFEEIESDNKQIIITIIQKNNTVKIEIADQAGGIPVEIRETLFSAFQTTKSSGMGIGLSICRSIIETHSGEITFETSDKGTKFILHFPIAERGR